MTTHKTTLPHLLATFAGQRFREIADARSTARRICSRITLDHETERLAALQHERMVQHKLAETMHGAGDVYLAPFVLDVFDDEIVTAEATIAKHQRFIADAADAHGADDDEDEDCDCGECEACLGREEEDGACDCGECEECGTCVACLARVSRATREGKAERSASPFAVAAIAGVSLAVFTLAAIVLADMTKSPKATPAT
jgi:hypothetical protein